MHFVPPFLVSRKKMTYYWTSTQDTLGDSEFAYTYDQVARNILAAFGMSPDEVTIVWTVE